jgi:LPS sulfotransferase NodH
MAPYTCNANWGRRPHRAGDTERRATRKTCLIAATPRCGSTLLSSAMYATGVLGRPDEYFNIVTTKELYPGSGDAVPEQLVHTMVDGCTPNGVLSIKFMPCQFQRFCSSALLDVFPDKKWIFVRRKNLLDQAISYEIALQTDAWYGKSQNVREPVYSEEALALRIEEIIADEKKWLQFFGANRIHSLRLWYNYIAQSPEGAARLVANHIAVPWPNRLQRTLTALKRRASGEYYKYTDLRPQRNHINNEWKVRFLRLRTDIANWLWSLGRL